MTLPLFGWQRSARKYRDARHPYPELSSFADTDLDRGLFFGREREIENLLNNLLTSDVVLLFGRSGYGKTSLINAGILQPLRAQHYFPVVCQLKRRQNETPLELIRSRMLEAAAAQGVEVQSPEAGRSVWEFFRRVTFRRQARRLRPVLILDQFEQLFGRMGVTPEWQRQFVQELSDLIRRRVPEDLKSTYLEEVERLPVESDERRRLLDSLYGSGGPDVKVLIAIREAVLPELESLRPQVPAIFSNTVRLELLTAESARLAITEPAKHAELVGMEPFTYEPRALDELIAFLSLDQRTGKARAGACIEPAQLQILCHYLSVRRLRTGAKAITAKDLRGTRGMQRIMKYFYYRLMRDFPRVRLGWSARRGWPSLTNFLVLHRPRKAIRLLCEYELITSSGYRNSLILDSIQRGRGVSKDDLDHLVNRMLLRAEPRLGTVFYELMHDPLIEPLRRIRRNRRWFRVSALASLILLPWAIFAWNDYFGPQGVFTANRTLRSQDANAGDRSRAFRVLAIRKETNFSKFNLDGVHLAYLAVVGGNFRGASLKGAQFDNLDVRQADFSGANLQQARFNNVDLRQADLRDAAAQGAQFNNSSFEGARVNGMNVADARFNGSDWWLADGWSDEQLGALAQLHRPQFFILSERYRATERGLQSAVDRAAGAERAIALNNIAWYRATNGANLIAASSEIEEAIRMGDAAHTYHYLDTRAYLRLQLGQYDAAVDDLEEAARHVEASAGSGPPRPEAGTLYYHLGLAYEGLKYLAQAEKAFARAQELGYTPTYERVLTPRLAKRPSARPPSPAEIQNYLKTLED